MNTYKNAKKRLDLIVKFYLNRDYVSPGGPGDIPHALSPAEWVEVKEWERIKNLRIEHPDRYDRLMAAWDEYFARQKYTPAAYQRRYVQDCFQQGATDEVARVSKLEVPKANLQTPSAFDPQWLEQGAWSVNKYQHLLGKKKELQVQIGFDEQEEAFKPEDIFK